MDIDYPDIWTEYEREGEVGRFRMLPPLLIYEHDETNARLMVGPVIHHVPPSESTVTAEKLRNHGHVLPHLPAEKVNTLLYHAMTAEGEIEQHHNDSFPDSPELPVVFSDVPIDHDRFASLDWKITVQYMLEEYWPDEEMPRPTPRPTPEVSFRFADRNRAISTLEDLLATESVDFDLPASISW